MMRSQRDVFLALPHYGSIIPAALPGLMNAMSEGCFFLNANGASLLAHNFNRLFVAALNMRNVRGFTHFAMHHADIQAQELWLDILLDELDATGADIVSAIIPIKDPRGVTSAGVQNPEDKNNIRRFTMREVMQMPETFDVIGAGFPGQYLMVNTGLWVCRFDRAWVDEFPGFAVLDRIVKVDQKDQPLQIDGKYPRSQASVLPEDWHFSAWAARHGLKVFATRKVKVIHHGHATFPNDHAWGDWETDKGDKW